MAKRPIKPVRHVKVRPTIEDLTTRVKSAEAQRVRIVMELDIDEENYSRDDLNDAAIRCAANFHTFLELATTRCEVVFLTTEEIKP